MPNFAAAREVASSPSGWASLCAAAGLKPKGRDTCEFKEVHQRRFCGLLGYSVCYLGPKDLRTGVDIGHIYQDPWANSVSVKCGFVVA